MLLHIMAKHKKIRVAVHVKRKTKLFMVKQPCNNDSLIRETFFFFFFYSVENSSRKKKK